MGSVQYSIPGVQSQYRMVAPSGSDVAPSGKRGPIYCATIAQSPISLCETSILTDIRLTSKTWPRSLETILAMFSWPMALTLVSAYSPDVQVLINFRTSSIVLNGRNDTIVPPSGSILMLNALQMYNFFINAPFPRVIPQSPEHGWYN